MLAQQEWHSKHIEQSGVRRLPTPREHKEEQERHKNNTLQQQPQQQQSGVSDPPRLKFNTTTLTLPRHKKHAYAFYATTPAMHAGDGKCEGATGDWNKPSRKPRPPVLPAGFFPHRRSEGILSAIPRQAELFLLVHDGIHARETHVGSHLDVVQTGRIREGGEAVRHGSAKSGVHRRGHGPARDIRNAVGPPGKRG
ncbi:hypothetical protein THAOC_16063 [Thalassiosira oceanica]|uniref:Uncharacterized protein n=1 Tax=Thalassiosira oceanica TaxID=159749 RepID=K0SD59_THAOC|nr:hypothetical protein THAOC_16063 [Thalassiosira oceanica]|eukprot:EJK63290.1 hypothetical protein THAOC_16063 [Thalassiosira oceanica]